MDIKKNKVAKVLHNTNSYTTPNGTFYKHQITFENGDMGDYNSKSETCTKFTEGQEASYTIESKVNGKYTNVIIKPATEFIPNAPGAFKGKSGSDESFALSYSKDIAVALIESGKPESTEATIERAEKFNEWLKSKKV